MAKLDTSRSSKKTPPVPTDELAAPSNARPIPGRLPSDPKGLKNRAKQLYASTSFLEARSVIEAAIELEPNDAEAVAFLGKVVAKQGDDTLAHQHFLRALGLQANCLDAHQGIADLLFRRTDYTGALNHVERILERHPAHTSALHRKAQILTRLYRYEEAAALCESLIKIDKPNRFIYLNDLGNLKRDLGLLQEALDCYTKSAALTKTDPAPLSNQITLLHYMPEAAPADILELCKKWGRAFAPRQTTGRPQPLDLSPNRTLRIGMVSDGFRQHPVGAMTTPALEYLAKRGVELYFYTTTGVVDDVTLRLMNIATRWTSIASFSDATLAQTIREDKIDILLDLSGHNAGTRLRTIAMEPAPLLVKWVGGLINTTGVESIDYLLTDGIESPPDTDHMYTEKLIRMPDDYICYMPPKRVPSVGPLPALRNGHITFGCFNNPTKLNEIVLAQWARLLHAVPKSRLYLKGGPLGSPDLQKRTLHILQRHGIDADRVLLEGRSNHYALFECYNNVDIALDPWPYSGGLTTCEAMLMGVPVVSLPGPTFAGRHSATHLFNAGMPELVTHDWDEYIARASGLASDLQSLSTIRTHLRRILLESPVCNGEKFAGHLADALRAIWQRYCDGKAPAGLSFTEHDLPLFEGDAAPTLVSHPVAAAAEDPHATMFSFSFEGKVVVLDHGADLARHPDFGRMASLGAFSTITIDPASKLNDASMLTTQGHLQHYQAHFALGPGSDTELHVCLDAERSGTLSPLPPEHRPAFAQQASNVIAKLPLPSTRLDDIDGLTRVDWLWLNDANDNLGILRGASRVLDSILVLQVGVRFVETYERQPKLHEIEAALKPYGFRLLRLNNMRHHSYLPDTEGAETADGAQLLSADAVFVPDESKLAMLDTNQCRKLAFLLHTIYQTPDLAYAILERIDADAAQRYLASYQALVSLQLTSGSLAASPAPDNITVASNQPAPLTSPVRKADHPLNMDEVAKLAASIPSTPHMEPEGRGLLAERLSESEIFLEYGSGGSSVMAAQSNIRKIYSVDSDETFLRAVQARIAQIGSGAEKYLPIYVDIGPTGEWGRPKDYGSAALWPAYANEPWTVLEKQGASPDLILIDGRFRVASFLASVLFAQEGCVILFDDYFDRPGYHVVEKYLKPVRTAGRMAEFVVPTARPQGMVQDLLRYCTRFE